jgi:hypothetical protein
MMVKRPVSEQSGRKLAVAVLFVIVNLGVLLLLAAFTVSTFVSERGNRSDFYPRYIGTQAYWTGLSPYDAVVTSRIQTGMFGDVLPDSVDQQRYAYPAYTSLLLAPTLLFSSDIAIAIWMSLQLMCVIWSIALWPALLGWQVRPLGILLLILILLVGMRYVINVFLLGQFIGSVLLGITVGTLFIARRRDFSAGVVMAVTAIPPTIALPVVSLIGLGYALRGRTRILLGIGTALLVLVASSVATIGWWIPDFLESLFAYASYARPIWPLQLLPGWPVVQLLVAAGLLLLLAATVWRTGKSGARAANQPADLTCTIIFTGVVLLPQTGAYYLTLLIAPLVVILHDILRGTRGATRTMLLAIWLLLVTSPWLYFMLYPVNYDLESIMFPLTTTAMWLTVKRLVTSEDI